MNNIAYNYLVHLRPLDFYFFGGETTFGNGEEANYYAKTKKYPQQTTLLGVLRYLGYKASKDIGSAGIGDSFSAEPNVNLGKYGYIEAISPLFFSKQVDSKITHYLPGPLWLGAQTANAPQAVGPKVKRWIKDDHWVTQYELPAFHSKKWMAPPYLGSDASIIDEEELLTSATKIGITKQTDGAERTDGFYKQELGYLQVGVSFSFLAKLDNRAASIVSPQVLPIGAEKALFRIELIDLKEATKTMSDYFSDVLPSLIASPELYTALLMSDAYVDNNAYNQLAFAVSNSVEFRYISTPTGSRKVSDFGRFNRHGQKSKPQPDNLSQSRKYNLLKRGSILYAEDAATLSKLLDEPRWQTIGYNHYQLLAKK